MAASDAAVVAIAASEAAAAEAASEAGASTAFLWQAAVPIRATAAAAIRTVRINLIFLVS